MKKFLLTAILATAFITPAFAADTISVEAQSGKVDEGYLYYTHTFNDGFQLGADVQSNVTGDSKRNLLGNNAEVFVGQKVNLGNVTIDPLVGVGEVVSPGKNFPYYTAYFNTDWHFSKRFTWNVTQFQYENSFQTVNKFENEQVGTGITYDVSKNNDIGVGVYRKFLNSPGATPLQYDGFLVSFKHTL